MTSQEEFDKQYGPRLRRQYVDDSKMTEIIQTAAPTIILGALAVWLIWALFF